MRGRCARIGAAVGALLLARSALAAAASRNTARDTSSNTAPHGSGDTAPHGSADAQAVRRVVLLDPSVSLARALQTALSPWGMKLESVPHPALQASSSPDGAMHARALAGELNARALVWLSSGAEGSALRMYETATDTLRVRAFPARALDDALAAALALSVKTWLLAEPPAHGASHVAAAPLAAPVLAGAGSHEPGSMRGEPADAAAAFAGARSAVSARVLVAAGARAGALHEQGLEARYGVELRLAAWRSEVQVTSLWLAAGLELAEPQALTTAAFRGNHARRGVGLSSGVAQRIASAWLLNTFVGVAVEHVTLSGTLLPDATAVDRSRWQAVAQLRPELELELTPISLLLQPTLYASPAQQRYLADGVEILRTHPVWWSLGGAISVSLF
ncbi:MAG: hypothetical protein RL033_2595 [Pseudomonadota bacterium]